MNLQVDIQYIAALIIPLIFAITVHEAAHGWVANKLGDPTALLMGRITLNPVKHIDWIGTIIIPIAALLMSGFQFVFGWAKPVPVTWENLKNPRRDMALVALAGPGVNVLMALIWAAIAKLSMLFTHTQSTIASDIIQFTQMASLFGIMINCILCLLNLIPLPPLDGSRVISAILPPRMAAYYDSIEPYGIFILLILLFMGLLRHILTGPLMLMTSIIFHIFGLK